MTIGGTQRTPARRRVLLLVLAGSLLVTLLSGYVVSRAVGREPSLCNGFAMASAERANQDSSQDSGERSAQGDRIVVIGDSYSVGLGLQRPRDAWPSRLPGRVHVDGFSGSGFNRDASPCGRVSFADRAAAAARGGADVVVVAGGLNDWDSTDREIAHGFYRLMRVLDGQQVLVVGPAAAPSRTASVPRINRALNRLSRVHGATFVRMSNLDLDYLPDGLHLTPDGHIAFGDRVAAAVDRLL
ncbi:MAG: SGNH/GDSL hydrolase family protein [Nocardioides sp.]